MGGLDVGAGGGDAPACGLDDALEVVGGDAAGAEDVAVGEVSNRRGLVGVGDGWLERDGLCCQVTDWQFTEYHFGSGLV